MKPLKDGRAKVANLPREPLSEFGNGEFDIHAFSAGVNGEYQRILGQDFAGKMDVPDDETIGMAQYQEIADLLVDANRILTKEDQIGREAIFAAGALVPRLDERFQPYYYKALEPIPGLYHGLGLGYERFNTVNDEGQLVISALGRPELVHRLLLCRHEEQSLGHEIHLELYAKLPVENVTGLDIFNPNMRATLPSEEHLESIMKSMFDEAGEHDFDHMDTAFKKMLSDETVKVPEQLRIDWFLDELNRGLQSIFYRNIDVTSMRALVYTQGNEPAFYTANTAEEAMKITGSFSGFVSMNEISRVSINGQPTLIDSDATQMLALVLEKKAPDGSPILVKVPVKNLRTINVASDTE